MKIIRFIKQLFIRRILCFIAGHKWKCVDLRPYLDTSYGGKVKSISFTRICLRCGKIHNDIKYNCGITDPHLLDSPSVKRSISEQVRQVIEHLDSMVHAGSKVLQTEGSLTSEDIDIALASWNYAKKEMDKL